MATASLPESLRRPLGTEGRFHGSGDLLAALGQRHSLEFLDFARCKLAAGLIIVQSHHAWSGQLGKGVAGACTSVLVVLAALADEHEPAAAAGEGLNCGALRVGQVRLSCEDQRPILFDALQTIAEHGFPTEAAADQRLLHAELDRPAVGIVQGVGSEGLQHGHIADGRAPAMSCSLPRTNWRYCWKPSRSSSRSIRIRSPPPPSGRKAQLVPGIPPKAAASATWRWKSSGFSGSPSPLRAVATPGGRDHAIADRRPVLVGPDLAHQSSVDHLRAALILGEHQRQVAARPSAPTRSAGKAPSSVRGWAGLPSRITSLRRLRA